MTTEHQESPAEESSPLPIRQVTVFSSNHEFSRKKDRVTRKVLGPDGEIRYLLRYRLQQATEAKDTHARDSP